MRIGIAQINTVPGALDQTVERMLAQAERAAEQGADLVVFPLAALAGIEPVPYADAASYLADVAEAVLALSEGLAVPAIVPVPVEAGDDDAAPLFDALLIEGETIRPLCVPTRARGALQADAPAAEVPEFSFGGLRFALAFGYGDLDQLDEYDYDVDVVLYLAGYPFALDDPSSVLGADLESARYVDDARATGAWMVAVGPVGGYGDQVFGGSSFVLDEAGALVAALPAFEEALQVVEVRGGEGAAPWPFAPEVFDAPFHLWQALCLGIHDFVTKRGDTDAALVLDGSLGSRVLLALASDALGPLHVHALVGAAAGQGAPSCRELARRLRVDQVDAPGRLGDLDPRDLDELALAAYCRETGAVALSSLDKTALALNGSGGHVSCAALLPLGDVYRTDVLDMAHVRNTISPLFRRVALGEADVLVLPDGTRIDDERMLARVDETLLGHVEYDRPLATLLGDPRQDAPLAEAVLSALHGAEASRRTLGPVLVASTRTLDDVRGPLVSAWHDVRHELPEGADAAREAAASRWTDAVQEPARDVGGAPTPAGGRGGGPDLEGTLALLRDLAEQGGFVPQDAEGQTGAQGGWGSIFSEN